MMNKLPVRVPPSVYDWGNLNGGNCNAPATLQLEVFGAQPCIVVLVDVVVVVVVVVVVAIKPSLGLKNGVEPHSFLFPDWSSGSPTAFPRLPRELWTGQKEKASQNQCNVVNMIDKKTSDYFCCSLTNTAVNPATVGRILMIFSADPYEISILMKWWKNISPLARLRLQKGDTVTPYKRNQSVLKDMSSCIFGKCKINHCY